MSDYIVIKRREGWAIREHWTEQMVIPVGQICPGSIQRGNDDEPGAWCTVPNTRDDQWVQHCYRELLGFYETKAHAERMIAAIRKERNRE